MKREGSPQDFLQLYREHEAALLQYLKRMLGTKELAREVAQETYERLQTTYQGQELLFPRAMLFKIATSVALMHKRRERREAALLTGSDGMDEVPDDSAPIEQRVMAQEARQCLFDVIRELPPKLRDAFILAYVQGLPRKDIAGRLGIPLKRLEKRLTQALKLTRERLLTLGIDSSSWVD